MFRWNSSKVRIGNYPSSSFLIENGLKQGDALLPLQEKDLWRGLGVDGRTILEWTLKR